MKESAINLETPPCPFSSIEQLEKNALIKPQGALNSAYLKCLKSSSLLGKWPLKEEKEAHVFFFSSKKLEVFIIQKKPLGQPAIQEKIPLERIKGGINDSISISQLYSDLKQHAAFFTAVLTNKLGHATLTFLPRLQGGVEEMNSQESEANIIQIRAKLHNVLKDPLYVGQNEFNLALDSAKEHPLFLSHEIPWCEFAQACAHLAKNKLKRNLSSEISPYCTPLIEFFKERRHFLDKKQQASAEKELHALFLELSAFCKTHDLPFQGRECIRLALHVMSSVEEQIPLLLKGGKLALEFAQRKRTEEKANAAQLLSTAPEYTKSESFQAYEDATAYFVTAYYLAEKYPEVTHYSLHIFALLCAVQGDHLRECIPDENDETACEAYAYSYRVQCSPTALQTLSQEEIQLLVRKIENAAEYLEACGYFRLAYLLYEVLCRQFKDVPGVSTAKYRNLTTQLGNNVDGAKAREHFLEKVQNFRKELTNIRKEASSLIQESSISLQNQKTLEGRFSSLIKELFETCALILDPKGRYPYALLSLGSLARQEMCPFSDFEVALLVENKDHIPHFRKVGELFHLIILSLGETSCSLVENASVLPKGFSLDSGNNLLYLCDLPVDLAERQKIQNAEDPVQQNALRSISFVTGKKELFSQYLEALSKALEESAPKWRELHAIKGIENATKILEEKTFVTLDTIDVKSDLLRFCVFAFEALCLYYQIDTSCHTIEKIQALCDKDLFPKQLQAPFQSYLELAFGLRWKSHLLTKKEQDEYKLEEAEKAPIRNAYYTLLQPLQQTLKSWLSNKEALQDPTLFAKSYFELAQRYIDEENFSQALPNIELAISLTKDPLYLKICGQLYFALGYFDKAKEIWEESPPILERLSLSNSIDSFSGGLDENYFSCGSSSSLPTPKESPLSPSLENSLNSPKEIQDLINLAQEQDKVSNVMRESFSILKVKKFFPFSKRGGDWRRNALSSTIDMDLLPFWKKSITTWLEALLTKENPLELFSKVYFNLPKPYCQEVKRQLFTNFADKLGVLQEFFCEEGYIFSAAAKRSVWLNTLTPWITEEALSEGSPLPLIEGTYLAKGHLTREKRNKLFLEREFKKTNSRGNHPVNETDGVFFKKNAESPGDEYAVFLLNHLITGQGSPPIEVLRINTPPQLHFLLASQKVEGEPLHTFFSNYPNSLSKIEKKQFSQMVLMALLTDPEDGKPDNYIANYTYKQTAETSSNASTDKSEAIESVRIIGIDNDHAFVKPFVQKGIFFAEEQLFIKTILFCFDQMKEPIHADVVEEFLQLDPLAVMEEWLQALVVYNQKVSQIFDQQTLYQFWKQNTLIPFFMHPNQVIYLYEKMLRIQTFLKKNTQTGKTEISHLALLNYVNSRVGEIYDNALSKPISPKQRFDEVAQNSYGKKGETLTTNSQVKKYVLKDTLDTLEGFQSHPAIPEEGLKVLRHLTKNKQEMEKLQEKLHTSWDTINPQQLFAVPLLEDLLKQKDWSKEPLATLEKIQGMAFRKLALNHFKALTDSELSKLLLSSVHPLTEQVEIQTLNLKGCKGLTNGCVTIVKKCCPKLEKLSLEETEITAAEFYDGTILSYKASPYLRVLNFKNCKKLSYLTIASASLKTLILENCSNLTSLNLDCPQLSTLQINGCTSLNTYQPSWQTPITLPIFSILKQFHQESPSLFTVKRSIGDEKVIKTLLKAICTNPQLQRLTLDFTDSAPQSSISRKVALFGHPTLTTLEFKGIKNNDLHPFTQFLIDSPKLVELYIEEGEISNAEMEALSEVLAQKSYLSHLSLAHNNIDDTRLEALSKILRKNKTLKSLNLSSNNIGSRGASALSEALAFHKHLNRLDLSNCVSLQGEDLEKIIASKDFQLQIPIHLLEHRNSDKQTLLHSAVKAGHPKIAQSLIDQGILLSTKDTHELSSLQRAKILEDTEMVSLLEKAQARKLDKVSFSAQDWQKYFGDIGTEPPLSPDIIELLESPCPFWPDKRVEETHILVLIPQNVRNNPLTLSYLDDLIQNPREGGHSTGYRVYENSVKNEWGNTALQKSYWVLLTKDILPNTRNKNYEQQYEAFQSFKIPNASSYRIPKALEVATCIATHFVKSGTRYFADEPEENQKPWTYTRCEETVERHNSRVLIGGFTEAGLVANFEYDHGYDAVGLAALQDVLTHPSVLTNEDSDPLKESFSKLFAHW